MPPAAAGVAAVTAAGVFVSSIAPFPPAGFSTSHAGPLAKSLVPAAPPTTAAAT